VLSEPYLVTSRVFVIARKHRLLNLQHNRFDAVDV